MPRRTGFSAPQHKTCCPKPTQTCRKRPPHMTRGGRSYKTRASGWELRCGARRCCWRGRAAPWPSRNLGDSLSCALGRPGIREVPQSCTLPVRESGRFPRQKGLSAGNIRDSWTRPSRPERTSAFLGREPRRARESPGFRDETPTPAPGPTRRAAAPASRARSRSRSQPRCPGSPRARQRRRRRARPRGRPAPRPARARPPP